uniref:SPOR domain-containing protein n=2 Tax=Paracidobacterium acidisoli TaxID=2303751 RepID=A0A372IRG1_9BACT
MPASSKDPITELPASLVEAARVVSGEETGRRAPSALPAESSDDDQEAQQGEILRKLRQWRQTWTSSSMTRRSAPLIIGVAVLLLIGVAVVMWSALHHTTSAAIKSEQSAIPAQAMPQPMVARPVGRPVSEIAQQPGPAQNWRVVVWTYGLRSEAEQKVSALAQKYPQFTAEVFSPNGGKPYLVTLGGWMSREQSMQLRAKAVRAGLPRDSYARNYRVHTVTVATGGNTIPLK